TLGALVVERRDCIGGGVELDVDVTDVVFRRPLDAVLKLDAAPEVDADTFAQTHCRLLLFIVFGAGNSARERALARRLGGQLIPRRAPILAGHPMLTPRDA